jgi:Animal haem peroxidase
MLRKHLSTFRKDKGNDNDAGNRINTEEKSRHKDPALVNRGPVPDEHIVERENVDNVLTEFAHVLHASQRPLPTQTGDGTGIADDVRSLGFKDIKVLRDVLANTRRELVDDKTYLMERVIQLVSSLPAHAKNRTELTNTFLDELWSCLQHPPLSYMSGQFTYRQGDGSYNNIMFPHLGAANTPYARSVQPLTIQPASPPDPGLVFDSIFARNTFKKHPNNVSSILFYWASIITHDLFQTSHTDVSISNTSSYLDLSVLYGNTQEDQDQIRTFNDGKLKPDCFSVGRLLGFPPGCGVLLIMFNRFHNYVVEQLAIINENGRFTKPSETLPKELAEKAWAKYDNDLFNTGRLITCGLYMNLTLHDYLRTIVNLNRSNSTWTLDPRDGMAKVSDNEGTRGIGNQVSAEFNLVYRWYSCTSLRDEEWTEELYKERFGKPAAEVPMHDLLAGPSKWDESLDKDPMKRPFAKLRRGPDGNYNDNDLVRILADSIEDCAGTYRFSKLSIFRARR